jgi:hypothetical protein
MTQRLNDTARSINHAVWEQRRRSPSVVTTARWHEEFIAQGLDRRQSFAEYRRMRMRQWHQAQRSNKKSQKK